MRNVALNGRAKEGIKMILNTKKVKGKNINYMIEE